MEISRKYNGEKLVIALGFFDSLHIGHRDLIAQTRAFAEQCGARCAVFTFSGNPYYVKDSARRVVLDFDERVSALHSIGVDYVISAVPTKDFFAQERNEFLDAIMNSYNVAGFAAGTDYAFGKGATGNADYLLKYANTKGIECLICDLVSLDGQKIATRDIAAMIEDGRVDDAADLLGYYYTISGVVGRGRGDGRRSCVPTVNLNVPDGKVIPRRGVYATKVMVDGIVYRAVTNVGNHPTYQDFTENVETFILDFDQDVYGKEVSVSFVKYLREISAFSSPEALKSQIENDVTEARSVVWKT